MIVMMVNKACEWCRIAAGTGTYTCPIKRIDGELFFKFKREWHSGPRTFPRTWRYAA